MGTGKGRVSSTLDSLSRRRPPLRPPRQAGRRSGRPGALPLTAGGREGPRGGTPVSRNVGPRVAAPSKVQVWDPAWGLGCGTLGRVCHLRPAHRPEGPRRCSRAGKLQPREGSSPRPGGVGRWTAAPPEARGEGPVRDPSRTPTQSCWEEPGRAGPHPASGRAAPGLPLGVPPNPAVSQRLPERHPRPGRPGRGPQSKDGGAEPHSRLSPGP